MAPSEVRPADRPTPEVLELLTAHPDGLPLTELAAQRRRTGRRSCARTCSPSTPPTSARCCSASPARRAGVPRPRWTTTSTRTTPRWCASSTSGPPRSSGWSTSTPAELGLVYSRSAGPSLDIDPDDAGPAGRDRCPHRDHVRHVAGGRARRDSLETSGPRRGTPRSSPSRPRSSRHHKVRIVYSRAWFEGVTERTIEPYRLVKTRRGWEVDAGPPDSEGRLRTFLLPHIRECDVLDETFEPPADLDDLLAAQRTTTPSASASPTPPAGPPTSTPRGSWSSTTTRPPPPSTSTCCPQSSSGSGCCC